MFEDPHTKQADGARTPDGPIIVFAGPCLPRSPDERWEAALDGVDIWPPAQRGDILRALGLRPSSLILLDGLYYSVPSVTHKELLYAIDSGVSVFGAASMGALRAAEMEPCGMVGVGRVFALFKDGKLDGDDEVAMLHGLEEHDYRPITLALVEVRHALEEISKQINLPPGASDAFLDAIKLLPFTERTPARLLQVAREYLPASSGSPSDPKQEPGRQILNHITHHGIKSADALEALELAQSRRGLARGQGETPRAAPLVTTLFNHFREWYLGPVADSPGTGTDVRPGSGTSAEQPSFLQAWQVAQLFHPQTPPWLDFLRRRFLLASAAEARGLVPAPERLLEIQARLQDTLGECPLPHLELNAEAHLEALAECALQSFHSRGVPEESFRDAVEESGRILAPTFGFDPSTGLISILSLLAVQSDLMPPWFLTRSFLFTSAREPALAVAKSAFQVQRAFDAWSRGGRLTRQEIQRVTAKILGCEVAEAEPIAAKRGLLARGEAEDRSSPGSLADAISLLAAAERLPQAANDYPQRRVELEKTALESPFLPAARLSFV